MGWAKVLLVDNELRFQKNLSTFLQMYDYKVSVAANGVEGLEKMYAEHPDIIILDPSIPGKSGYEIFEVMQQDKECRGIPVVMLLSSGSQIEEGLPGGITDFIAKSCRLVEAEKRIRRIVQMKRSEQVKQPS